MYLITPSEIDKHERIVVTGDMEFLNRVWNYWCIRLGTVRVIIWWGTSSIPLS